MDQDELVMETTTSHQDPSVGRGQWLLEADTSQGFPSLTRGQQFLEVTTSQGDSSSGRGQSLLEATVTRTLHVLVKGSKKVCVYFAIDYEQPIFLQNIHSNIETDSHS